MEFVFRKIIGSVKWIWFSVRVWICKRWSLRLNGKILREFYGFWNEKIRLCSVCFRWMREMSFYKFDEGLRCRIFLSTEIQLERILLKSHRTLVELVHWKAPKSQFDWSSALAEKALNAPCISRQKLFRLSNSETILYCADNFQNSRKPRISYKKFRRFFFSLSLFPPSSKQTFCSLALQATQQSIAKTVIVPFESQSLCDQQNCIFNITCSTDL